MTSYELRRRVRNQIKIVKKQIEENLQKSMVTEEIVEESVISSRPRSPVRKASSSTSPVRKTSRTEQQTQQSSATRQSSTVLKTVTREETVEKRAPSPSKREVVTVTTTTTTSTGGRNRKIPQDQPKDEKPIWAQKNILKKASENFRTTSTTTKKVTEQKAATHTRPKPTTVNKESRVTDSVTSSYGIGPTDDDGRPIFGLRALKKKTPSNATVTGTVVRESYYSENGGPATGERTVTMYSNDEDQLKGFEGKRIKSVDREDSSRKLITVTKSQKIVEGEVEPMITTVSSTTNNNSLTRRGSVKEMSEKFIQKESSTSTKVNGSSYPKAGLILRTQSNRSRSTDVDSDENVELRAKSGRVVTRRVTNEGSEDEEGVETQTTTTTTRTTKSFLNSAGEKVTDVNDVLDRMRNADNGKLRNISGKQNYLNFFRSVEENGDTEDDREARALLNKFLGASVLMSGVESMMPSAAGGHKEVTVSTSSVPSGQHQVSGQSA